MAWKGRITSVVRVTATQTVNVAADFFDTMAPTIIVFTVEQVFPRTASRQEVLTSLQQAARDEQGRRATVNDPQTIGFVFDV